MVIKVKGFVTSCGFIKSKIITYRLNCKKEQIAQNERLSPPAQQEGCPGPPKAEGGVVQGARKKSSLSNYVHPAQPPPSLKRRGNILFGFLAAVRLL